MKQLPAGLRPFNFLHNGAPGVALWCPGCKAIHHVPVGGDGGYGGDNRWGWNAETGTLSPSIKHWHLQHGAEYVRCHYFVKDGQIEFLEDTQGHALRGLHPLTEAPPENYGGREHFGWAEAGDAP